MDKNKILNLLFPSRCVFCRDFVTLGTMCENCKTKVDSLKIPPHLQQINNKTFKDVDKCVSFYYYEGIVRDGLLRAKKKSCKSFTEAFLQYISFDFESFLKDNYIDTVISMPFHISKLYNKEFDLPQLMAEAFAKEYNLEYNKYLVKKVKRTKNQHKLNLKQRKSNLKNAFRTQGDVKGKTILIVDDITTSGNSLEELAKTLKQSGADKVFAVTFAYDR